jgi:hypothetical protein
MTFSRVALTALQLILVGVVGVVAALAVAVPFGRFDGMVAGLAFAWCTPPATVLAALAYGGVHLIERIWPRVAGRGGAGVITRVRRALGAGGGAPGAVGPASFHADVVAPPLPPPSPVQLGVAVAVPLAFLNVPGWLALEFNVVSGLGGAVAVFVVPGVVCGALIGLMVQRGRRAVAR